MCIYRDRCGRPGRGFGRRGRVSLAAGFLMLRFACLAPLPAQEPRRLVVSASAELVVLRVGVLDGDGRPVAGLPKEAFSVSEDGVAQPVQFFDNQDAPVTVGLVIDTSGSMRMKKDLVRSAVLAFAESSNPDDEMFTVFFNDQARLGLPSGTAFTTDVGTLRAVLGQMAVQGQTALYDATYLAMTHLAQGTRDRKVLIVVSDGADNASRFSCDQIVRRVDQTDVVIYALGLYSQYDDNRDPESLKRLAQASGGEAYFPDRVEKVDEVLKRIARDIRSGYTIGYVPPANARDGFRRLEVQVKAPGGRRLSARTRPGYFAGPS